MGDSAQRTSPPWAPSCLRSEEHTSELQSRLHLVCRLLLEKKKNYLSDRASTRRNPKNVHPCHAAFLSNHNIMTIVRRIRYATHTQTHLHPIRLLNSPHFGH